MRTQRTLTALAGLVLALSVRSQWPCDSMVHASFQYEGGTLQDNVVHFHNTSWSLPGAPPTFVWSFGDGSTSVSDSPAHTYAQPGVYTACLIAIVGNCSDSACAPVVVGPAPAPCDALDPSFSVQTQGRTAYFSNNGPGGQAYFWNFGDGATSFGPDPMHTFPQAGAYEVCLKVWTWDPQAQDTCFADHCMAVTVTNDSIPSPCDGFNAGFQATTSGNTVLLHQSSTLPTATYEWSMGDGNTIYGPDPVYTYVQPGQYHVCLTAWRWTTTDQDDCMDTQCEWVTVGGGNGSPCDSLFIANIDVAQQNGVVFLTATSSLPAQYSWSLGDGSSAYGPVVQHQYAPGQYNVCLYAYTAGMNTGDSCFTQYCRTITVIGDSLNSPCNGLNAGFQASTQGQVAQFYSSNVPFATYFWDFGDGTTGYGPNPTHTYPQAGQYNACLTMWAYDPNTQDSCVADHCEWITINGGGGSPCDSLFQAGFSYVDQNGTLLLNAYSSLPAHFQWDLGDNTSAYGPVVQHDYAPGQYMVCVYAFALDPSNTLQDSCFTQYCQWITVADDSTHTPCQGLDPSYQVTTNGNVAHFLNNVFSNLYSYSWAFGDGSTGYGPNPVHTYGQPGQYQSCLTMTYWDLFTQDTCSATYCQVVTIGGGGSPCDSLFFASFDDSQMNGTVMLTASSTLPAYYQWYLGDGSWESGPVVQHHYAPGQYTVCLYAYAPLFNDGIVDSCSAVVCRTITVDGDSLNNPCDALNANFQVSTQGQVAQFYSSSVPFATYYWSFGDGTTGYGPSPTHTYAQPGQYPACLMTYTWDPMTQDTCVVDHCEWITIYGGGGSSCDSLLQAQFDHVQFEGDVVFTASTLLPAYYQWDLGDGSWDNGPVVQHSYAPGQYTVCLYAYADVFDGGQVDSCYSVVCRTITVDGDSLSPCDALNAGFQASTQGHVAQFYSSNVPFATYYWNFGDGTTGYGPNPTHTYPQAGQYHACLLTYAWDPMTQDTCVVDHCEWITINGGGSPCDSLFQVQFDYDQTMGSVVLTASSTLPAAYTWDLGDNTTAIGPVVQHSYAPGVYTVCVYASPLLLQVDSCVATYCGSIVVIGDTITSPCDGITAGFLTMLDGATASFDAMDADNLSYEWHFGDGTTGQGAGASHTYAQPGQYHVCLVTWNWDPMTQDTCWADHCEWITVLGGGSPCDSLWTPSFTWQANDGVVTLTNTTNTSDWAHSIRWYSGGSLVGDGEQAFVQPGNAPALDVCMTLTIYNDAEEVVCTGTICDSLSLSVVTGIDEASNEDGIAVYPQPFSDRLTVNAEGLAGPVRALLLDMSGRIVDDRRVTLSGPTQLDYSGLPAGTYMLRLQGASADRVVRVLKN